MRTIVKFLIVLVTLVGVTPFVSAQNENEKIDILLEEISALEKEVEEKKLEVQKLTHDNKQNDIEWLELNKDITTNENIVNRRTTIEKIGVDYKNDIPELTVIYHVLITGTEKTYPGLPPFSGELFFETPEFDDSAPYEEYETYLLKDGEEFIEGDKYELPSRVAPGWEGYYKKRYKMPEAAASYYLSSVDWKIAILNTPEPFGTFIDK